MKLNPCFRRPARPTASERADRFRAQLRRHAPVPPAPGPVLRAAVADSPESEGILWWRLGSRPWWRRDA